MIRNVFEYLGDRLLELSTAVVVALICCGIILSAKQEARDSRMAYSGWVKQTGNAKELTFEEWRALNEVENPKTRVLYGVFHVER